MNTTSKDTPILLSKKGMKELRKNITRLEHEQQSSINALRELDRTSGRDERLTRIEKLSQLEIIESELLEKRNTLSLARLLPTKRARLQVAIGSVVDIIDQQGRLFRYTIVDTFEADPSDGRISILSPLGKNLIGKTVQDIVEWSNGMRTNTFQLVRIS
jgi:transcription elongation factor GreA